MRVFIIRHGQTTANIGQANGELEANIPLTEVGVEQCANAAKQLKEYCKTHNIDLSKATTYFSPYLRTQNTAENICKELGLSNLVPNQRITERDFGKFATNEYARWDPIDKEENAKYLQSLKSPYSSFYHRLPGGESVHDCYLRIEPFTNELKLKKDTDETIIIVTHRISGKCILMNLLEEDIFWYNKTKDLPNCSVICLKNNDNNTFDYEFIDGYKLID